MEKFELIWIAISVLTMVFSAGVAWGVTRATLKQHMKTVEAMDRKLTNALYEKNGMTVFVPRKECLQKVTVFNQIAAEIKELVSDMDAKREDSRKETATELKNLSAAVNQLVGRFGGGVVNDIDKNRSDTGTT